MTTFALCTISASVRVPASKRDAMQVSLKEAGIDTGIHYPIALPYLNAYRHLGHTTEDFPCALEASAQILSLPMFPELNRNDVEHVACTLRALGA